MITTTIKRTATMVLCGAAFLLLAGCDIEQTDEGRLPDVDVDAEAGQLPEYEIRQTQEGRLPDVDVDASPGELPEYDVDTVDVDVGTKETQVTVPDVDVDTEERTITVPDVDVDMPDDDD